MRGYGLGLNLSCLLKNYWKRQMIVSKASKCLGIAFETGRGLIQGDPTSPMVFNIMVDAVVRAVLNMLCGPQEAHHGMDWAAGERNLVFHANDSRIVGWDHEWVQDALTVTAATFYRMVLDANLEKTKAMVCTPRFI